MFYTFLVIIVLTLISAKYLFKIRWKWEPIERKKRKALRLLNDLRVTSPEVIELEELIKKM